MAKVLVFLFGGLVFAALSGCNTVKGVGKDIEKAGESVQRAAQ